MSRRPRPGTARVAPALLTAAGAAVAGGLVTEFGLIGFAGVLGLLLAVLGTRLSPKKLAIVGLVLVLLSRSIEIGSGVGITSYTDEVVTSYLGIVLVGRRLLERKPLRWPTGMSWFAAFVLFGVLSSVVSHVPLSIAAAGGALSVKGLLLYLFVAQVDWTREDIPWLARIGTWILGVALVCAVVNLVAPKPWTAVLSVTGHSQYRWILPSVIGPFTHPLQFGGFMCLAAIACAAPLLYRSQAGTTWKGKPGFFLVSVVGVVLSFRRTAFVGLVAGLSFLALRLRNAGLLVTAFLVVSLGGVALYPVIHQITVVTYDTFVVQGSDAARTRLTVDSVTLALEHFPLGVGFGRFGSAPARDHYSPEYERLGYQSIHGMGSPDNPHNTDHFLTDTQWPAVVGETGILGFVCFVMGVWGIFRAFRKAGRASFSHVRLLGLTGMGWTVHILFESVAYPVFVTAPTSPALFGLAGVVTGILATLPAGRAGSEGDQRSPIETDPQVLPSADAAFPSANAHSSGSPARRRPIRGAGVARGRSGPA